MTKLLSLALLLNIKLTKSWLLDDAYNPVFHELKQKIDYVNNNLPIEAIPELKQFESEPEDYISPPVNFTSPNFNDDRSRSFASIAADPDASLHAIDRYGCWCNFQMFVIGMTVGGEPQDYLDGKCQELYYAYWCGGNDMNTEENPDACHLERVVYNPGMTFTYLVSAIVYKMVGRMEKYEKSFKKMMKSCKKYGKTECEWKACQIEAKFMVEVAPEVYSTIDTNDDGVNVAFDRKGEFDAVEVCGLFRPDAEPDTDRNRLPIDQQDPNIKQGGGGGAVSPLPVTDPNFIDLDDDNPIAHQPLMSVNMQCCGILPFQFMWDTEKTTDKECCDAGNILYHVVTECCNEDGVGPCGL